MRRSFITTTTASIALLLIISGAAPALALTDTGSTSPSKPPRTNEQLLREKLASSTAARKADIASSTAAKKEDIREKIDDRKANIASTTQNRKEEIRKHALEQLRHLMKIMAERYQAAIDRLGKLVERISSRMEKLKSAGVDTSAAEAKKTVALSKIADAQTLLNNAKSAFALALATASTSKESVKESRGLLASTTEAIKSAHRAVVDLLVTVEKLRLPRASSTPATTSPTN